jgi:hypothetical protein
VLSVSEDCCIAKWGLGEGDDFRSCRRKLTACYCV